MPRKKVVRKKLSPRKRRELEVQTAFLEGIVRRDPQYLEALQLLGDSYSDQGRHADSLIVDRRLIRKEPRSPHAHYNLACSYSLTGRFDRAAAALERAINLGYSDFGWLTRDPDLSALRKHAQYRRIEERIRDIRVKVV